MQLTLQCDHCNHTMLIQKPSSEEDINCESCKKYIKTFSSYIEKNTIVNEQYQIKYPVCEDNCSQTFIAFDINSESLCNIRIFDPEMSKSVSDTDNFIHVLQSAASIAGKSHIRIAEQGIDDDHIYQVSAYAEIESLADIVDENNALDPTEALDLFRELLLSLDEASIAMGTGHFNLTPFNIFMDKQGDLRYSDFGLASQLIRDSKFLESNYHVLNIHYMSPEMALAWSAPNAASDIYSIGCLFFFALTGMDPFAGIDSPENIDYGNLLLPRRIEFDLDRQYIDIFQKMTATNPLERYQSYREVLDAIERYRNSIHTTSKIGKARAHRSQIYNSDEFHNLETTHNLRRKPSQVTAGAPVDRDKIRAQMSSNSDAPLPQNFAKKMSSKSEGQGQKLKGASKKPSRRGQNSASPSARRGQNSSSPARRGQNSSSPARRGQNSASPGARPQGAAPQNKRPLPPRGQAKPSGGNGVLVGTLVVTLILVVVGAAFLLNQQKQEIKATEQAKVPATDATETPAVIKEEEPKPAIIAPLSPEFAEHIHWLKTALQTGEYVQTEFLERLEKVRPMAEGRPRSMAMVNSIEQDMKADQQEKQRLIIVALKSAVQDLVYQKKFDEAIAICEDDTTPNASETSAVRKELLTKINELKTKEEELLKAQAEAQQATQLENRTQIIDRLTQSICLANSVSTNNLLEELGTQVPTEQITSQEMLTLVTACSPESRATLVSKNLSEVIGSEISIFQEDQRFAGPVTTVQEENQSFTLKFMLNNKSTEREFSIKQLPTQVWHDLLKTDSTSDSAFIRFWHALEKKDFAQAAMDLKGYEGHYAAELTAAMTSRINERATQELSQISESFKLKELTPDQLNISQADAIVAHHLLSKCLTTYQDTAIVASQKEKVDTILTLLQSKIPNIKKVTFVGPTTTNSTISIKEALLNPKAVEIILLPGSYGDSYQINKLGLKISGCTGVEFTQDINVSADEVKIKNIHFTSGEIVLASGVSKTSIENCFFKVKGVNLTGDNNDILINNCILHGVQVTSSKRLKITNSTLLESAGIGNASSKFCVSGPVHGEISNSIVYAKEGFAIKFDKAAKTNFNIVYSLLFAQRGHIHHGDKKISISDPKEVAKTLDRWSHSLIEQPQFVAYGSDYRLKNATPGFAKGEEERNMGAQLSSANTFMDITP